SFALSGATCSSACIQTSCWRVSVAQAPRRPITANPAAIRRIFMAGLVPLTGPSGVVQQIKLRDVIMVLFTGSFPSLNRGTETRGSPCGRNSRLNSGKDSRGQVMMDVRNAQARDAQEPVIFRREAYLTPAFAVDSLELDVMLDPQATKVKAKSVMRCLEAGAPLVLD